MICRIVVEFVLVQQVTCKLGNERWKTSWIGKAGRKYIVYPWIVRYMVECIYYLLKFVIENHVKYHRHTYRFSINSYSFTRPSDCTTRLCLAKVLWQAKAYLPLLSPLIHVLWKGPSYCATRIGLAKGSGQASVFFSLGQFCDATKVGTIHRKI